MRAELIDEKVFTITVNGVPFPGMRRVSEWNGLVELRNSSGEVLIVSIEKEGSTCDAFDTLFSGIFRTAKQTRDAGVLVVMGSPALLDQLRATSGEKEPAGVLHPVAG